MSAPVPWIRTSTAFALAPAAGIAVAALSFQVIDAAFGTFFAHRVWPQAVFEGIAEGIGRYVFLLFIITMFGGPFAYFATVIAGVPLHLVFEMKGWRGVPLYLALGLGLTLLALSLFAATGGLPESENAVVSASLGGLVGGLVFRRLCFGRWLPARAARPPDRF